MRKLLVFVFITSFLNHVGAQAPTVVDTVSLSNLKGDGRTMIALTFGQSNAANNGQTLYTPKHPTVLNYYEGKLYPAKDPLKGATNSKGSVWTRLGDMLIDSGQYSKVIFIPIAVGGTELSCWTNGDCFKKLQHTLQLLDSQHITLTHIFWHQGESDNLKNTSTQAYKEGLDTLLQTLHKYHQTADFYVSIASYHPNAVTKPLGVDNLVRNAQKEFINENKGVFLGPDTDSLIYAIHRYDSVHFSEYGMKAFAQLWLKAIRERKENITAAKK